MRRGRATSSSVTVSINSFDDDVGREILIYENTSYTLFEDNNPLLFWSNQQQT